MAKPTLQILAFICLVFSVAIGQELRGRARENDARIESPQQADMMSLLEQSHFNIHDINHVDKEMPIRALTRKKSSGLRGGFDLKRASRPRNTRDPEKLKKQYGLHQKTIKSTRKKPYNSAAAAAAAKGIQEKKAGVAGTTKKGKKKSSGFKSSLKNFGKRIKGAGKRLKDKIGKRKKKGKKKKGKRGKKKKTKQKTGKVDTAPGSTQTEPEDEGEDRVEPQNPLKGPQADDGEDRVEPQNPLKDGGLSTSQTPPGKPQTPLAKPLPQAPVVKPKPDEPLEQPTVIEQPKEPETIPALQQGGVAVQPPLEEDEPAPETKQAEPVPEPLPRPAPAPDTPAPVMLAVGANEEISPVAAPAYSPSAPFAPFAPSLPQ